MELHARLVFLKLELIIDPENEAVFKEIKDIQRQLSSKTSPLKFGPKDQGNVLRLHFKFHEESITILEENGVNNAKSLTVFEFRSKMAYYQKRAEESKNPPVQ